MGTLRRIALVYMVILLAAASLNYIPGLTDAEGRAFGVFALDIFDDALHVASALWAGHRGVHVEPRVAHLPPLLRPALPDRRPARAGHRFGLPRPRHRQSRRARPAADVQDPRRTCRTSAAARSRSLRACASRTRRDDPQALAAPATRDAASSQVVAGRTLRRHAAAADRRWRTSSWRVAATPAGADLPAAHHRSGAFSAEKRTPT